MNLFIIIRGRLNDGGAHIYGVFDKENRALSILSDYSKKEGLPYQKTMFEYRDKENGFEYAYIEKVELNKEYPEE